MKRFLSFALVFIMCMTLFACGNGSSKTTTTENKQITTISTTKAEESEKAETTKTSDIETDEFAIG